MKENKTTAIIVFIFGLLLVSGVYLSSITKNVSEDQEVVPHREEYEEEYKIGDEVRVGNRMLGVGAVERTDQLGYDTAGNEKEYLVVGVVLGNVGGQEFPYNTLDFRYEDEEGAQKSPDISGYGLEDSLGSGYLSPNGIVSGVLVFEVPKGDLGRLVYAPATWSDRIVISLR